MFTWDAYLLFLTGLFSIMNPIGAVPVWLTLSAQSSEARKRHLLRKIWQNMLLLLLGVLFLGTLILSFFGITVTAIRIAGALMIIFHAFALLRGQFMTKQTEDELTENADEEFSFAPLTMPLLVGPGTIAIILSYSNELGYVWSSWDTATGYGLMLASILVVTVLTYLILRYSTRLLRWLGSSGLVAATKVMGFLLLSVGMQILIEALRSFYLAH